MKSRKEDHPILDDKEIIALYQTRDENAIRQTEKKYSNYLTTIALNILGNREDGEECVNDTYLKTWNTIPPNIPAVLKSYLGKITRELSIDRLRKKQAVNAAVRNTICHSMSLPNLRARVTAPNRRG